MHAQPLVSAAYELEQCDPAWVAWGISVVDQIIERVANLTLTVADPTGNINAMVFTDGKPRRKVSLFFWTFFLSLM